MPNETGLAVVALYAGLSVLIGLWLAVHVGRMRNRLKIFMGDAGHPLMIRAMRGQANFLETVPLALVLMLAMAAMGTPGWVLHLFGVTLVVSRVLHGMHFTAEDAPAWQRGAGAGLSFLLLLLGALGVIGHALVRLV